MRVRMLFMSLIAAIVLLAVNVPTTSAHGGRWTPPKAEVRVAHFSPDAPNVDVYVNKDKVLSNVPFGAVSPYLKLKPGRYTFAIRVAGAAPDSKPVFATKRIVLPGRAYTVAAIGQLKDIRPKVYQDAVKPPAAGKARVRAIHAAPDVPAVDVAVKGGSVLISNLAFPRASRYLEVPAGTYPLEVRVAGTSTVLLTIDAPVKAGSIYTIAAIGLAGAGTAKLLPIVDRSY